MLLGEPDAPAILAALRGFELRVSRRVIRVELRRLALREDRLEAADQLLAGVALLPLTSELLARPETLPPKTVATLDALHLATALRLAHAGRLNAVVTYDVRLAEGAREHGLRVVAPE